MFSLAVYLVKPPKWLKPSWLRQAEANHWNGYVPEKLDRVGTVVALVSIVVLAAAVVAMRRP